MSTLSIQIEELLRKSYHLINLGMDGSPLYDDDFTALNEEVFQLANALFTSRGRNPEEEATLCLGLLMAYSSTIYNHGDKHSRIQTILNRSWEVLEKLPASFLKCSLLVYCYGEIPDDDLAFEAHSIINTWRSRTLTEEEMDLIDRLEQFETYQ